MNGKDLNKNDTAYYSVYYTEDDGNPNKEFLDFSEAHYDRYIEL